MTATNLRLGGLVNTVVYGVRVCLLDRRTTRAPLVPAFEGMPEVVDDFWETYKAAGGARAGRLRERSGPDSLAAPRGRGAPRSRSGGAGEARRRRGAPRRPRHRRPRRVSALGLVRHLRRGTTSPTSTRSSRAPRRDRSSRCSGRAAAGCSGSGRARALHDRRLARGRVPDRLLPEDRAGPGVDPTTGAITGPSGDDTHPPHHPDDACPHLPVRLARRALPHSGRAVRARRARAVQLVGDRRERLDVQDRRDQRLVGRGRARAPPRRLRRGPRPRVRPATPA